MVKNWNQKADVFVRESLVQPLDENAGSIVSGLFTKTNVDEGIEIARMVDPVTIRTEQEFRTLEITLAGFKVGEIDSYVYCGRLIVWDKCFLEVNEGKRSVPNWYRMNHSSSTSKANSGTNVKPSKINGNIVWKTTRRVQRGEELRYDYVQPDESWAPSPARKQIRCVPVPY